MLFYQVQGINKNNANILVFKAMTKTFSTAFSNANKFLEKNYKIIDIKRFFVENS